MGMFDDLIPKKSGGMFDDLIPDKEQEEQQKGFDYKSAAYAVPGLANADKFEQMTPEQQEQQKQDKVNMARATAQGALFGNADEAEAVFRSMFSDKTYTEARDSIRAQNAEFKEREPVVAGALEIGGGLSTGVGGVGKSVAATAGSKIVAGTKTGAALGAVGGAGYSEEEITSPEFAKDVATGAAIGGGVGAIGGAVGAVISKKVQKNEGLRKILETDPDGEVVTKQLVNGKMVDHAQAKKVMSQGLPKGDVVVMRLASPATKRGMLQMLKDYQAIANNSRVGQRKQVSDVVGKAAMRRYNALKSINRDAGSQIDDAAKGLKGVAVDVQQEVDGFLSTLESKGVKVDLTGKKPKIDFSGSDFEGLGKGQKPIQNIIKRMFHTRTPDAHDVHRLKRYIDNNVTYGVGSKTGAQAEAENLIKGLRSRLDGYLDNLSEAYDRANSKYAATIKPVKEIESLAGKNGVTDRTLGILANRNDSRAVSSDRVAGAYDMLDEVSEQMGIRFKDSVSDLHIFANTLDKALPNQRQNTARGQFGRIPTTSGDLLMRGGEAVFNKVKGVTPESKIKAIRELLLSDGSFEKLTGY